MATQRFWTFVDHKLDGPFDAADLKGISGFTESTLVCPEGDITWSAAKDFGAIRAALGLAPPARSSSQVISSGDVVGPNFQFDHSLRRRQPLPSRPVRRAQPFRARPVSRPAVDWTPPKTNHRLGWNIGIAFACFLSMAGWAAGHPNSPWVRKILQISSSLKTHLTEGVSMIRIPSEAPPQHGRVHRGSPERPHRR